ncbi:19420_t:CDS:2 [Racocetra fulgida]|uniref:19420_t:CDS:1 n=1 Tax=Racocetra fulgida TaxID=60492 RepID=A0A9N9DVU2_9GLOM|nr:19420_t:CDS:2 [Racocetra fulgida]
MVNPRFIPENVFHYADIGYATNVEAQEAKKDGIEQINYLTLDVYARKSSTLKPVLVVVSAKTRPKYPTRLFDAKRALRWVKENIKFFGGDPDFVAVGGMLLALTPNVSEFQPGFEDVDTSVKACILINAVTDLSEKYSGSSTIDESLVKKHSPIHLLREDAVPFLVFHGDRDDFIPIESSSRFVEEYKKSNCYEFIL